MPRSKKIFSRATLGTRAIGSSALSYRLRLMRHRVIVNYACHLPVIVPSLCLLPLHTHRERSISGQCVYFRSIN
jgi:hypothetical protein